MSQWSEMRLIFPWSNSAIEAPRTDRATPPASPLECPVDAPGAVSSPLPPVKGTPNPIVSVTSNIWTDSGTATFTGYTKIQNGSTYGQYKHGMHTFWEKCGCDGGN